MSLTLGIGRSFRRSSTGGGGSPSGIPASITTTFTPGTLTVAGPTVQLVSVVKDKDNNVLTGVPLYYTTTDRGVATVSSTGLVTRFAKGTCDIKVSFLPPQDYTTLALADFRTGAVDWVPTAASVIVTPDPTGFINPGGFVGKTTYSVTGSSADQGWDKTLTTPIGRDKWWRFSQSVVFPTGTFEEAAGRKYLYPQFTIGFPFDYFFVIGSFNAGVSIEQTHYDAYGTAHQVFGPSLNGVSNPITLVDNVLYVMVLECLMESFFGAGDGIARVYLNGTLIHEQINCRWSDVSWIGLANASDQTWTIFRGGEQAGGAGVVLEDRYFGYMKIETKPANG